MNPEWVRRGRISQRKADDELLMMRAVRAVIAQLPDPEQTCLLREGFE